MTRLARALVLIGALLLPILFLGASPAYADGNSGAHGFALAIGSWPVVLAGACGWGASQLTAILTQHNAPQWLKSSVSLALTSLAGVLITIQVVPGHTWKDYLAEIAVGELVALGTHYSGMTAFATAQTYGRGFGDKLRPLVSTDPALDGIVRPRGTKKAAA